MKNLFLCVVAACALTACGGGQDELTELVQGTCECSSEIVAFFQKVKEAPQEEQMAMMAQGQELQAAAEKCMKEKDLETKMEALEKKMEEEMGKEEAEKKMKGVMEKECPEMFKMMEGMGQ